MNAMISPKIVQFIDGLPLFEGLLESQRDDLKNAAKLKAYMPGQTLTEEGTEENDVFWLLKGEVQVTSFVKNGQRLLANLGAGDIVGEVSLATGVFRTSTVTAATMVEVVVIPGTSLEKVMAENPLVKKRLIEIVEERALSTLQIRQDIN